MIKKPPFLAFPFPVQKTRFPAALVLQFLLSEILKAHEDLIEKRIPPPSFLQIHLFPYEGSCRRGRLSTISVSIQDLTVCFSSHKKTIKQLERASLRLHKLKQSEKTLAELLQSILTHLEPLISSCKGDENLFLFLLKAQKPLDRLMRTHYLHDLLVNIYPEGLEVVGEKLCDQYHRRGFFSPISECKLLLTQLIYARSSSSAHL